MKKDSMSVKMDRGIQLNEATAVTRIDISHFTEEQKKDFIEAISNINEYSDEQKEEESNK